MLRRLLLFVFIAQAAFLWHAAPAVAGSEDTAIRELRAAAVGHSARGNIDDALSKFDSAILQAERAYGRDSLFVAEMYFDAGLVALKGDRYQKAESCLTRAVELNPHSTSARLRLAEFFKKRGQMKEAKDQVRKVLQRHPDCLEARQLLALTYQQEGNFTKATQECFVLSQSIKGKEAAPEPEAIAFVPPPPVVAAPPPPVSIVSATASIRPSAKPPVKQEPKVEAKKPEVKKPEPKKVELPKSKKQEKKKSEPKKAPAKKPVQAVADTGPQSSWGLPARLKSKAVLLTPIKGNKNAAAESQGGGKSKSESEVKAEPKPEPKPEPKAKAQPKPVKEVEEDTSSANEDEGFGGSSSAKPKPKTEPKAEVVKPRPVQVVKPEMVKRPRAGLVPPPPPVIPSFPAGMMVPPPPAAVAPPLQKPKPKPVVEKVKESTPDKHSAGPGEDDSDFLLEWGGKKKK